MKIEHVIQAHESNEKPDEKINSVTWLLTLSHFINKQKLFKGIKVLLFMSLLILVIFVYGHDIYTKFQKQATTFTTKTVEAANFDMPPIIICMGNGLKPTVMKKYGIETIFDFTFGSKAVKEMSLVWDVFVEGSYIINRDFKINAIKLDSNHMTWGSILLTKGHNYHETHGRVGGYDINVTEYYTVLAGTCYQINSNFPLPPPYWINIQLIFNESLNKMDIPQVNLMWVL